MKNKFYILVILLIEALIASPAAGADLDGERAQLIKAAFLCNFIKFVDWPNEDTPNSDDFVIMVIGSQDFTKAFDPVKDKQIKGKPVTVKYIDTLSNLKYSKAKDKAGFEETIATLKKSHIVFIDSTDSASEVNPEFIIEALKEAPVLIVGEHPDFLEKGGHINFLQENNKIRFEINLSAAKKNQIKITAQLLKLARRIIGEEPSKDR